ncbi:hypothetical protein ACFQRC_06935 [Enterovirga sp. GCM10030262]|uniref:hypothetical protein n=1 Tax=Enterovirga sp. GCM10030262 TaxID=3273391 RepID=UPI003622FB63
MRSLPMGEQRARAFQAAFSGEGSPVVEVDDQRLRYSPGRLVWIGDRAVLLSPGKNLDKCHACAGALAIHYLEPSGDGFRVTGSWPALVQGSGYGDPPSDWSLSDRFAEYPVLIEEGGYTAQGCTSGGVTLTELKPERPVQSALIRTIYSNQSGFGADNGTEIDGEIVNIQKGVSFDVAYSGSRAFTETWVRWGDTFEPRGETRMPQC